MHRLVAVALALVLSTLALSSSAYAATFDPGPQLAASACGVDRTPYINVVEGVRNDDDSGFNSATSWATDNYMRTIQVWQVAPGTYCAVVKYVGSFVTRAGTSPMGTGTVTAGIRGVMRGGYRSTAFAAVPRSDPAWAAHGFIGVVDYRCDGSYDCPGRVSWLDQYFSSNTFDFAWWGWEYRAGSHGTWINAMDGSSGDIN